MASATQHGLHEVFGRGVRSRAKDFDTSGLGLSAPQVNERLLARGVRIGDIDAARMRAVTHIDVDRAGVEEAASALREVVNG